VIFGNDVQTYNSAKKASDGLEHGFLEVNEITAQALKAADKTFHCIRRTVVGLLGVSDEVAEELLSIKPKDVQSTRKVVRGRLVGAAEDPAAEGELYPILEWNSAIVSLERQEVGYRRDGKERFTIRTHPPCRLSDRLA